MAKPYRRRKAKGGPYVGNFRVNVDGRDVNLQTKDAREAMHRAKLAVSGKWPPAEAATRVALATIDPGRAPTPPVAQLPVPPPPSPSAPEPTEPPPAEAPIDAPPVVDPPPGGAAPEPPPGPAMSADDAARAAAREAGGVADEHATTQAEREAESEAELRGLMGELTGPDGGGQLVDSVADLIAATMLWAERKSVELGWNWTFRKPTGRTCVTKPHAADGIERKCIRVGMKAVLMVHFPELASKLTPGWAIGIGCVLGAGVAFVGADFVDDKTGKVVTVGEAMAQTGINAPIPMPGAPAPNSQPPPPTAA
jgi:hypothetical protein